jgi:hypothetical protein
VRLLDRRERKSLPGAPRDLDPKMQGNKEGRYQ